MALPKVDVYPELFGVAGSTIDRRDAGSEAALLSELIGDYPGRTAWLSFSCRNGREVSHGEPFADCAALAEDVDRLCAVGVNCTSPEYISSLLESARGITKPLVVYPNSGETWVAEDNCWIGQDARDLCAAEWYRGGARLLGGCCRIGPGDIARMRSELLELTA